MTAVIGDDRSDQEQDRVECFAGRRCDDDLALLEFEQGVDVIDPAGNALVGAVVGADPEDYGLVAGCRLELAEDGIDHETGRRHQACQGRRQFVGGGWRWWWTEVARRSLGGERTAPVALVAQLLGRDGAARQHGRRFGQCCVEEVLGLMHLTSGGSSPADLQQGQPQDTDRGNLAVDAALVTQPIVGTRFAQQFVEEIEMLGGNLGAHLGGERVGQLAGPLGLGVEPARQLAQDHLGQLAEGRIDDVEAVDHASIDGPDVLVDRWQGCSECRQMLARVAVLGEE